LNSQELQVATRDSKLHARSFVKNLENSALREIRIIAWKFTSEFSDKGHTMAHQKSLTRKILKIC
jgi:hypothetical protein